MITKEYLPLEATHPGFVLKEELKARDIKQKDFARDIDMQPTMLNELLNEKRSVTAEIALLLEKALEIPADFWMRFQVTFDLDCARIKERNIQKTQQIEIWGLIKQFVPAPIFAKLGLLTNSLSENISKIWEIYEVNSIDELIQQFSVHKNLEFYRKSEKLKNDQVNVFAWSKYAKWKAKSEVVPDFDPAGKEALIAELKTLFFNNQNVNENIRQLLNRHGIKFLIIERFKQSPIDGFSFWSGENPAVVVTLRRKYLDSFAFTVMHELGHVFLHLLPNKTEEFLDVDFPGFVRTEKENQADKFAQESFISGDLWHNFMARNPVFNYKQTESEMIRLSNELKVHPSIIFGRFCYETEQFSIKTGIDRTIK